MTKVLGVRVDDVNLAEVLAKIAKEKLFIVTVNPEFVMLAQDDLEFKNILNNADLAVADGMGLKLAGIKNIIPGRKLVAELLKKPYKVFFLGGRGGVAEAMAKKFGGFFDEGENNISNLSNLTRNQEIVNKINKYKPDILLVAYGAPWQEKWIYANKNLLNAKVCIGVGGAFDYLAGRSAIPPEWVNRVGLEWLWRFVCEPWRWKRQLSLIRFIFAILKPLF